MALFERLWPRSRPRRRRRATLAAFHRAERERRAGRLARAMAHVRRGLTLDPESLTGHLLAAYLYAGVRATALARAEFRWVLRRHPAHPRALLGLARIALEEGDVALCRDMLGRAMRAFPIFPEAEALLAAVARPAPPGPVLRLEHVRPPEDGCELVLARLDGAVLAGTPGGIRDLAAAARGLVVLRLAASALARAGFGALRRAVVENTRGADFARSDGELVLALSMPRHTEWSLGLLQVNRLWAGALHELGQTAPTTKRDGAHRRVS